MQFPIARAYAETEAADLMVRKAAALFDAGEAVRRRGEHGQAAGRRRVLARGRGVLPDAWRLRLGREYDVERKWRETRLFQTAPISTNLVLAYLAEHVLGLPRSYRSGGEGWSCMRTAPQKRLSLVNSMPLG